MTLHKELNEIKDFVQQAVAEQARLEEENRKLKEENQTLRDQVKDREDQLDKIQNKALNLHMRKTAVEHFGKEQFNNRIDEMVEEIDKCLKLLNNQFSE